MAAAAGLADLLAEALGLLRLPLGPGQQRQLLAYVDLLARWNRAYNLTAVREPREMLVRHVLDSLVVEPALAGDSLLDLGTGAGLPGLVLAVARPDLRCVLLDSNGKKVRFCRQAVAELGLANVEVSQARLESYRPDRPCDSLVARALGALESLIGPALRLASANGRLLLMKGAHPAAELAAVAALGECAKVVPLHVPGLVARRHLLVVDLACARRVLHGRAEVR
jgi:16S rRNA (guanine527-N7)-methyltransferase